MLTPYDVLRLCQGMRITTGEFLDYYGQITLGPASGLPVCWLDFEKVQRWRGEGISILLHYPILSAPATSPHPPYDQGSDAEPHDGPHWPEMVD